MQMVIEPGCLGCISSPVSPPRPAVSGPGLAGRARPRFCLSVGLVCSPSRAAPERCREPSLPRVPRPGGPRPSWVARVWLPRGHPAAQQLSVLSPPLHSEQLTLTRTVCPEMSSLAIPVFLLTGTMRVLSPDPAGQTLRVVAFDVTVSPGSALQLLSSRVCWS